MKSLGQTPAEKKASELRAWFYKRRQIDRCGAEISVFYAPAATEEDVKEALSRVRRLLKRTDRTQHDHLVVTIPRDPDYKKDVEIALLINNRDILIFSAGSLQGRYGCSFIHREVRIYGEHPVKVREAGFERDATAGQLGLDSEDLRLALIVTPSPHHEICSTGYSEIGEPTIKWPDLGRLRKDAQDARTKFKNALNHKKAPSLVIYVSMFDSQESCAFRIESLKAMLYGLHTVQHVEGPDDEGSSTVIHGRDAFWTARKNTSVSAACYVSGSEPVCVLHNPWARYPLPTGLIGCREYRGRLIPQGPVPQYVVTRVAGRGRTKSEQTPRRRPSWPTFRARCTSSSDAFPTRPPAPLT